jgi:hypothetical protein
VSWIRATYVSELERGAAKGSAHRPMGGNDGKGAIRQVASRTRWQLVTFCGKSGGESVGVNAGVSPAIGLKDKPCPLRARACAHNARGSVACVRSRPAARGVLIPEGGAPPPPLARRRVRACVRCVLRARGSVACVGYDTGESNGESWAKLLHAQVRKSPR